MDEMVSRCQSCGYEQSGEPATCPVCHGASSWWCRACGTWSAVRMCLSCAGLLHVPGEVELGPHPAGSRLRVQLKVRNTGKKPLAFNVSADDPALSLLTRHLSLQPREERLVNGVLTVSPGTLGRRSYRVRYETHIPLETTLGVEVVPAVARVEFVPPELAARKVQPGLIIHRNLTVNNTGNVPIVAKIELSEPWLGVLPTRLTLAVGESAALKVVARTRKTDHGRKTGTIRIVTTEGEFFTAQMSLHLPEPKLEASPLDFGEVRPDQPSYQTLTVRNTGQVRLACRLGTSDPWLAVSPPRINIPAGGEKVVKVRALASDEETGHRSGRVHVLLADKPLLDVPVTAEVRVPRPILGSVRKQSLGAVALDEPVVRRFSVMNAGDGRLVCTVEADRGWIEILTPELPVLPGKKRKVEYRIQTALLKEGDHAATIRVRSNGGDAAVPVTLSLVPPNPVLTHPAELHLGTATRADGVASPLAVRNSGVGTLRLNIVADDSRASVSPSELSLAPGPPARVLVAVAVDGLAGGDHSFKLHYSGTGGSGETTVHFRVPVEAVEVPERVDLGDLLGGRRLTIELPVKNTSPDPVRLSLIADQSWLKPRTYALDLRGGEAIELPVLVELPEGVYGRLNCILRLEGRTLRRAVAVTAVARRIKLVAVPAELDLGNMKANAERAIVFQVSNWGDYPAEIKDLHVPGELEVWVRRRSIQPGASVPVIGRAKLNADTVGRRARTSIALGDDALVHISARVSRSRWPQFIGAMLGLTALAGMLVAGRAGNLHVLGIALGLGMILLAALLQLYNRG